MSIDNVARNRLFQLERLGKAVMNMRYPKDFELYLCALELMDQEGNTLRYFVFPVMPSSMEENKPKITNIKKTLAGITVLSTPTFIPTEINLSGNFGRKFRILLGSDYTDFISSFKTVDGDITKESFRDGVVEVFDDRVKTGYGCIKILEEIVEQADQIDEKGVRRLVFYNLALGNSYLVKPMNLKFSQSEESNMIWNYSLQMKSIAPLESLMTSSELEDQRQRLIITGFIQKGVDNLVNKLTGLAARSENALSDKLSNLIQKWK